MMSWIIACAMVTAQTPGLHELYCLAAAEWPKYAGRVNVTEVYEPGTALSGVWRAKTREIEVNRAHMPAGSDHDVKLTLTHEIGHALGLGHVEGRPSVMAPDWREPIVDSPTEEDKRLVRD